jgi:hypothetical protein
MKRRPYIEKKLKSEVVTVKGKKYRMFFTKRTDKYDRDDSWTWTQIKPYGIDDIISSYISANKEEGYRKGMKWLRSK